jgi:chemotaxis protein methyltransferase CheR
MIHPVPLDDEAYRLLSEWIAEEYGLRYGPEKRDILRARLEARRLALGLNTFRELYFRLKFHPDREKERRKLIPHLTNNFFRESRQLEVLRDEVLPELRSRLAASPGREIRLVSAGCASGEEAYTLSIVARQAGLGTAAAPVRVTGLDVDPHALDRARAGLYRQHAFRGVPEETRERWFDRSEPETWSVRGEVRENVEFREVNLARPGWHADIPPQHVVFCRNALIYFDDAATRRAVQEMHDVLVPGGYLFLGHAESLSRIPTPMRAERREGAVFYRRPEGDEGA